MKKTILILLFLVVIVFAALNTVSATQTTERASIADSEPDDDSEDPSITPDGRYIAFESTATNLVSGDTNGYSDIFVKDGWTGAVTRVSATSTGGQADGNSYNPVITPDGRYVAFESLATNLVASDTNGLRDIFVKDGWTGTITRVSTTSTGAQATGGTGTGSAYPVMTPDARYIAFESTATNLVSGDTGGRDIFVKDGWTGAITMVSTTSTGAHAGDDCYRPFITPDGRYIAFYSYASNLVSGDSNGKPDVFVKDGWSGSITRVSTTSTGGQATGDSYDPVMTPDGRYVAFESRATNLVSGDTNGFKDIFVKDGWTGAIIRVSTTATGQQATWGDSYVPSISNDGRYIAFDSSATNLVSGDSNGYRDIFVKDGWTGAVTRVSINPNGDPTNDGSYMPVITPDGRYIAYYSDAEGIVTGDLNNAGDIFVYDRVNSRNVRISTSKEILGESDDDSHSAAITPDGRYVAFDSLASNLVADDTNGVSDVFVHDNVTNQTIRVSTTSTGAQATGGSWAPSITPDGRYIAFQSYANNLVSGDTNTDCDVFVKDMLTGKITRISTTLTGAEADKISFNPSITPDGRYIAFESDANNLVSGDSNNQCDIFVKDGWTGVITRVSTTSTGVQANSFSHDPIITPNGRYIVFDSWATNLVSGDTNGNYDVFVKDGWTGQITRVSTSLTGAQATGGNSVDPSITPDGRYIVFESAANNLVSGDTNGIRDIFVKDGWTGAITRVSTTSTGGQATSGDSAGSYHASITSDGRYVAFYSWATNLVSGDTNGKADVFVKDGWTGQTTRVSTTFSGAQADGYSYDPVITPDGRYVAFETSANLLGTIMGFPIDINGAYDIYVKGLW